MFGDTHAYLKERIAENQSVKTIGKRHSRIIQGMGWNRNSPGRHFARPQFQENTKVDLQAPIDLGSGFRRIMDQSQLGSCAHNASAALYEFDEKKQGIKNSFDSSRLFNYFNTRWIEGTINEDSGSTISDAIKALDEYGTCDERKWPYDIARFRARPVYNCYLTAKRHKTVEEYVVEQQIKAMVSCLQSGFPFEIGASLFDSFMSDEVASTGIVPMPILTGNKAESLQGGHAMTVCGYQPQKKMPNGLIGAWKLLNSWGENWGEGGFLYMPLPYLLDSDLSADFRMIKVIR